MPRYYYNCSICNETSLYRLGFNEEPDACVCCQATGSLLKVYNQATFNLANNKQTSAEQKVGSLTKEYIEENRKILEIEKEKAKQESYEPT